MRAISISTILLAACHAAMHSQISPLTIAAREGDTAAIRQIVASGASPDEASGGNGWTPLLHAIHKHQNASVVALLDSGANVNFIAKNDVTPLMMAAGYGYDDTVRILLARGAKPTPGALDWALTGITDIDRFTFFECQDSTVQLLRAAAPAVQPSASSRRWARVKRCAAAESGPPVRSRPTSGRTTG